ncbi:MAG: UvrD-helicase domain-containing protein [Chloroflexi bacterium]|nr:UvrD-helicase domain-containing protein [Chloroflexota bacterium]
MTKVYCTKPFSKDLSALKTKHSNNYRKATAVLLELQMGQAPDAHRRDESRIPKATKFELDPDYRLLIQRVDEEDAVIALCVGNHDHVDSFLDGHKGWVFDSNGNIRELRMASATEEATQIVVSQNLQIETPKLAIEPELLVHPPVFGDFTAEMLTRLEITGDSAGRLMNFTDPNDFELLSFLSELEDTNKSASDLLLSYVTGDTIARQSVLKVARGEAEYRLTLSQQEMAKAEQNSDEIFSYNDPAELQQVLERGNFDEWQLFLHPTQKELATRHFLGPARIRGLSGSGKTVVGLHRARHLAKQLSAVNQKAYVLYTTFNKALAQSASNLLDSLCGSERDKIEVTHIHRWCLDFIDFRGLPHPRYDPQVVANAKESAWKSLSQVPRSTLDTIPQEYVWEEIEFIFGRFMHEEVGAYLTTDRTGRGRAISENQRRALLSLYHNYMNNLRAVNHVDFPEFVRIAYRLLLERQIPERNYVAVIVDEVQDVSEIGLKMFSRLVGEVPDGLLLIGDGTQRIYTRGYSLRGLGIDVSGRAVVLTKNYRNTQQILEAAFPLVEDQWASEMTSAQVMLQDFRPQFSNRQGMRPAIVKCDSTEQEAQFLQHEIKYLLQFEGCEPSNICIMARSQTYREMAYDACRASGIPAILYNIENPMALPDSSAVRISSLHSAKGHEYKVVFIVGCVDGVIPLKSAVESEDLAEERAVLYVGMTRARDILYLSHSVSQNGKPLQPSPFLKIIEEKCDLMRF